MFKNLFNYFKLDKNCYKDVRYSYFTDDDLVDDTSYIYKLLFDKDSN
jgi:hypothetical protein